MHQSKSISDTASAEATEVSAQSYISAARQERPAWTLKFGDTFGVFSHDGDIDTAHGNPDGLFFQDTRHLSKLALWICGLPPLHLCSTLRSDNGALTVDLTNPDLFRGDDLLLEHDLMHVRRLKFLYDKTCFERLAFRNYGSRKEHIAVRLEFAADFADVFEVRGSHREHRGTIHPAEVGPAEVILSYTGLDRARRKTHLRFFPQPARLDSKQAIFEFDLAPRERQTLFVEICCTTHEPQFEPAKFFYRSMLAARRALRKSSSRAVRIVTSNDIFNEAVDRALSDLYMLNTDLAEGPYPYAGIPWFSTVFGRDGLVTALQTLWIDPLIARGVLGHLAANQAQSVDDATDAEPGKILHESRRSEMAETGEVPFRRYYGSIDSTPLFVILAGAYLERTGDVDFLAHLWPHILAALDWIDTYGDRDGDGFVEYLRRTKEGLANQGWKDSYDSVFHADGRLAMGPIALVEVQAYVFAAKEAGAVIARRLGEDARAQALLADAEALRRRFDAAFWDEALGTYVLALDGEKQPCRIRTSNAGHALFTGIALPERAEKIVQTLTNSASFSGWGIRTVARSEQRYNPMSYHNGSVWPHDNALIAHGLARYGFGKHAAQIFNGLFDASTYIDLRRLPELFCGFSRGKGQGPTFYPLACSPQAWAATSPLFLLQSCLGLTFHPERGEVAFVRPVLPAFLDEVTLRGLSLGAAKIDVALRRTTTAFALDVLAKQGDIRATLLN